MQDAGQPRAQTCRLCATDRASKAHQYELLTEVLDAVKLDDDLRTSIISDELMRATSNKWRRIQRDSVPVILNANKHVIEVQETLEMFLKEGFRVTDVNLSRDYKNWGNKIGDEGMMILAPVLIRCPLQKLNIKSIGLSHSGAIPLALITSCCSSLMKLILDFNDLGVSGAICLGRALQNCPLLQVLSVNHTYLQTAGFVALSEGLTASSHENQSPALIELNVGNNNIGVAERGEQTADPLFSALSTLTLHCINLQVLNLSENYLCQVDIIMCVRNAKKLRSLHLDETDLNFDDRGACDAFMKVLEAHTTLTELRLCGSNSFSGDGMMSVARGLPRCTTLTDLDLSFGSLWDPEAFLLAKAVARSPHITYLDVEGNYFSLQGVNALKKAWLHGDDGLTIDYQEPLP